ncbi:MAG: hypothetical protein HN353_08650 [Bdellovibrionales bacterium]|jgi:GPI mannosyltransferase 3|nr:hypothetical protein [Bdellovibrionales bacterium]MBT3526891.1 hypothetical protein [Bdellovibrionales bacterium]MBT7668498.1 hypothetical protein [Bdellovibrionales bacterium]MBT7767243.1 hypothetical protein [Bdellovibrionales bacterium]
MKNQSFFFYVALFFHIVVPIFSVGFLHPDEQYYVLDFAFDKLGLIENYSKTWEYQAAIRPWLLPGIFYSAGAILKFLGTSNPFVMSLAFRLLSSLFAFVSHFCLLKEIQKKYYDTPFKNLFWMFFLSWPILLMHARTSSENWSSSFFFLSLSLLINKKNDLWAGTMAALAFFSRFQIGILLLPFLLLYNKSEPKRLFSLSIGFLFTAIFMVAIDYWGYQELTLTPYNYLVVNIIDGKVNTFGTNSSFYYLYKALTKLLPFWGLASVFALLLSLKRVKTETVYRDGLILLLPFLIVHHLIGHKELRFIYIVFPLSLILLARVMDEWKAVYVKFFMISNFLVFPVLFIPAYKPLLIYNYIYSHQTEIKKIYYFSDVNPLGIKSLLPKGIKILQYSNKEKPEFVLAQNYQQLDLVRNSLNCKHLISTYPYSLIKSNPFGLLSRSNIWSIFSCTND